MNIITGYRGEPHITSAQDRAGNQGSYGTGSYVLNVGNKLAATIASANEIRIADGALCHQGCLANIDAGTYDSVAINNGTQGMNRIDRIVARYTKNAETNVESLDLVVIEGTAVSGTPSAPAYNTGNIQNGDSPVDMPLYQVRLTGVTVASVTKEFDYVRTQKELDAAVSSLNSKLTPYDFFTATNSSIITDGLCRGIVDKTSKTARITLYARHISQNIPTNSDIFTLPELAKPKANWALPALFILADGTVATYYIVIKTTGVIDQGFSSSVRGVFAAGEYAIAQ